MKINSSKTRETIAHFLFLSVDKGGLSAAGDTCLETNRPSWNDLSPPTILFLLFEKRMSWAVLYTIVTYYVGWDVKLWVFSYETLVMFVSAVVRVMLLDRVLSLLLIIHISMVFYSEMCKKNRSLYSFYQTHIISNFSKF